MSDHTVQFYLHCEKTDRSTHIDLYGSDIYNCTEKYTGVVLVTITCPLCKEDHEVEIG